MALTTFRCDGTAVVTPVSLVVVEHDVSPAVMRKWRTAGKTKRIRNNPSVGVAASTFRGVATGPAIVATARLLDDDEATRARSRVRRKHPILHGVLVPLGDRLRRFETQHYELSCRAD